MPDPTQTTEPMSTGRLETFTDGVIAVIITVLVLNLRAPSAPGWAAWRPGLLPLLIYAIGFQLTAAMWILHHNTMVHIQRVNRKMIWANFVFLLTLSLFPLTVQAMSLHPEDPADLAVFCINAVACGTALSLIRLAALSDHKDDSVFRAWHARRNRLAVLGLGSVVVATCTAFYSTYIALGLIATALLLVLWTG